MGNPVRFIAAELGRTHARDLETISRALAAAYGFDVEAVRPFVAYLAAVNFGVRQEDAEEEDRLIASMIATADPRPAS